jgi:uncharacterized protein YkwD
MRLIGKVCKVGLATAILSVLLAPGTAISASGDNQCWKYRKAERGFARKINLERSDVSLGKLKIDPELSKVARKHAKTMAGQGTIFHQTSTQLGTRVTNWTMLGENVGVGATVTSLHNAFMNSPGHAANVLRNNYVYHGIGTVRKDGRLYVTVVFQASRNPGTTLSMPRC